MSEIVLKRAYEKALPEDGYRVLIDRLWPRGISKEKVHLDEWNKDLAPSTSLREWFDHDPVKWNEFSKKYYDELEKNNFGPAFLDRLKNQQKITLLYGAKDEEHCHPLILKKYLDSLNIEK